MSRIYPEKIGVLKVKKRFLGIPIAVIIAIAIIATLGTLAGAAWAYTRTQGSTVTIEAAKNSGIDIFTDAAATIPLSVGTVLNFGSLASWNGQPAVSSPINFYLKNTGQDTVFPVLSVTGLATGVTLNEATFGLIGTNTKLYVQGQANIWTPNGLNGTIGALGTAVQTDFTINAAFVVGDYVKIANAEIVKITASLGGSNWTIQRAQGGTTAVAWAAGAAWVRGTLSDITANALTPGEIQPVSLVINVASTATAAVLNPSIVINAISEH